MKDGRARMVNTFLVVVLVRLAAAFVHTLLGHGSWMCKMRQTIDATWKVGLVFVCFHNKIQKQPWARNILEVASRGTSEH
jgi:hypothetical protein